MSENVKNTVKENNLNLQSSALSNIANHFFTYHYVTV